MKHALVLGLMACLFQPLFAQPLYDAASIPKELTPYAGSIVRQSDMVVELKELDNVSEHYKRIVTVLNKAGDDDADLMVYYNKLTRIKSKELFTIRSANRYRNSVIRILTITALPIM